MIVTTIELIFKNFYFVKVIQLLAIKNYDAYILLGLLSLLKFRFYNIREIKRDSFFSFLYYILEKCQNSIIK